MVFPKNKREILDIVKHPLALSSLLVFTSTYLGNIFAYLFNLLAARFLGPADYGILSAVIALMGIVGIFSLVLSVTVTKFVSSYKGRKENDEISRLVGDLSKVFFVVGLVVLLFVVLFNSQLADFFNIPYKSSLILVGVMIFISNLLTINTAAISGLQKFSAFAVISFCQTFLKFSLGLTLILIGLKVDGAVLAIVLTAFLTYLITFWPLKGIFRFNFKKPNLPLRSLIKYSLPAFFSMWGITLLTSTDVVLVNKFFDHHSAGVYSFAALVGRVVLFASASVTAVMFPVVSQRQASGQKYKHLLFYSLAIIFLVSLVIDSFYFVFPQFTLRFFTGFAKTDYPLGAAYVGLLGFYYLIFSLCNSLNSYFLSIHKTLIAALAPSSLAILQIILITRFHANFWQVIESSIVCGLLLLGFYLVYLFSYDHKS